MARRGATLRESKEDRMQVKDIEIVVFVVTVMSLFGGVLGWASWDESRRARQNRK